MLFDNEYVIQIVQNMNTYYDIHTSGNHIKSQNINHWTDINTTNTITM